MFFNKKPKCCFCGCNHKDIKYVIIDTDNGDKVACKMCAVFRGYTGSYSKFAISDKKFKHYNNGISKHTKSKVKKYK